MSCEQVNERRTQRCRRGLRSVMMQMISLVQDGGGKRGVQEQNVMAEVRNS